MLFRARSVSASLLLASVVACAAAASRTTGAVFKSERALRSDSIVVHVLNHADRPVAVSVVRGTELLPLGDVKEGGDGRFPLPSAGFTRGRLALVATLRGGSANVRSGLFQVQRGQVAVFDVTADLTGSRVYVNWPR